MMTMKLLSAWGSGCGGKPPGRIKGRSGSGSRLGGLLLLLEGVEESHGFRLPGLNGSRRVGSRLQPLLRKDPRRRPLDRRSARRRARGVGRMMRRGCVGDSRMIAGELASCSRTFGAGDEHGRVVLVVLHQAHAADLLEEGGEAHVDGLDLRARHRGSRRPPGRRSRPKIALAVVERRVGVLAADDEVGEAQVLAVDGVHDGLGRAAVVHAHVQADQLQVVVQVLALHRAQSSASLSPSPEQAVDDQGLVGLHAGRGRDVVALELADEGVEHDAGLLAVLAQDHLGAVDQRVLVGAVQRVAGLEGDGLLPTAFSSISFRVCTWGP